ncbi:MAG TPA: ABC transporter substrate-binding protein [Actinomycetota bacterium]|nr:ABC transporter substrate-binding protein [Actinomycetota bacterium]
MSYRAAWWRGAAVVAALALVLGACGSSKKKTTTTGTTAAATPASRGNVDGILKIGILAPQTGDLASLGPPQFKGAELAVKQINDAGGVLGKQVQTVESDDGGGSNTDLANTNAERLITSDKVDAIMGAASSGTTKAIIDKVTGAGVVECSPSNTASELTTITSNHGGYYFRTAPPDNLQGPALANVITGDGHSKIGVIVRNDSYGVGFGQSLSQALQKNGATVVAGGVVAYDPKGTAFDADVKKITDAKPDAVALISFPDTGGLIIKTLIQQGFGPTKTPLYTADGMQTNSLAAKVDPANPGAVKGIKGTVPSGAPPGGSPTFPADYKAFAPGLDNTFAAHAYDCLNVIALAAVEAKTDDSAQIHAHVIDITHGANTCNSFSACKALLDQGKPIHYIGASGPLNFVQTAVGGAEPSQGVYDEYSFGADGKTAAIAGQQFTVG